MRNFYKSLFLIGLLIKISFAFSQGQIITKIRFYPRSEKPEYPVRMVGGVFEATNGDEITGPYTTLYTVTSEPPISTWTEITLSNATTPYKYARYRAAGWCNVAEIEFYSGNNQLSGTVYGTAGSWNNSGLDYTKVFEETITG